MKGFLTLSLAPTLPSGTYCTLSKTSRGCKHSDRLLSSLQASSDSPVVANRLIRKYVASSSKSTILDTLSHFLSISSPFALSIYEQITETSWFQWNPKLTAKIIAMFEKQGQCTEAKRLTLEADSKLTSNNEIVMFYCDLIEALSEHGLKQPVLETYEKLRKVPFSGKRPNESLIKGLCSMALPIDAEEKLKEMVGLGFHPSSFELRLVLQSYGKLGLFSDMRRVLEMMEDSGLALDAVGANMVLSCYGDHGELFEMVCWIKKMKEIGIGFSMRTYNSVLNSCTKLVSMVQDMGPLPLSIEDLIFELEKDPASSNEALLVHELIQSSVLVDNLAWSPVEGKLDLHGFHIASSYVIMLQWLEELKTRFSTESETVVPQEISVVCGVGKNSKERRESPVKRLVSEMMFRMNSSLRIDRKNVGRFTARGKAVRDWLCPK